MGPVNRQWRVVRHPAPGGPVSTQWFTWIEDALPEPGEGEILARTLCLAPVPVHPGRCRLAYRRMRTSIGVRRMACGQCGCGGCQPSRATGGR